MSTQQALFSPSPSGYEHAAPFVRHSDTSKAAAKTVHNAKAQGAAVLDALRIRPLTDDGIYAAVRDQFPGVLTSSIRRARICLMNAGRVQQIGTRLGDSGRMVAVWAASDAGN